MEDWVWEFRGRAYSGGERGGGSRTQGEKPEGHRGTLNRACAAPSGSVLPGRGSQNKELGFGWEGPSVLLQTCQAGDACQKPKSGYPVTRWLCELRREAVAGNISFWKRQHIGDIESHGAGRGDPEGECRQRSDLG